ncbi:MAG: D-alanyl-D-alanine carboxypeptidase [Proteobacteria bacterium]|nr:D-alanyl-D-alanine carboxypeptidase [Pseudomonadota bacterium]
MKRLLLIVITICMFSTSVNALKISARAYVLKDVNTGKILLSKNASKYLPPASTTKLMTLYLLFEKLKNKELILTDRLKVSKIAWKKGGSKMFLNPKSKVRVVDLIKGIAVSSGNDASTVVAEYIAGTEKKFVKLMNKKAKEFGMERTNFYNATGWDNRAHFSTAGDLAILGERVIKDFPQYYKIFSLKSFKHNGIRQYNKNTLLGQLGVDGLKTGHVSSVGYNIVSSAMKNGTRYVAVVLGAKTKNAREKETKKLYEFAYNKYKKVKVLNSSDNIVTAKTFLCDKDRINIGLKEDLDISLMQAELKKMKAEIQYYPTLNAPVFKNQEVGEINILFDRDSKPLTRILVTKDSCSQLPTLQKYKKMLRYYLLGDI